MSKAEANFLFEMGMLAKQHRTGWAFIGTGHQSIAEHVNRVCYIGYILACMDGTVAPSKVVMICLFHDMAEARSLDLNYTAQHYVTVDEHRIINDQTNGLPGGDKIQELLHEYFDRQSLESLLAKDADNLEVVLFAKEQSDLGNTAAYHWLEINRDRMKTQAGKDLFAQIEHTPYNERWQAIGEITLKKKM